MPRHTAEHEGVDLFANMTCGEDAGNGAADLGEFIAVLRLQVALHVGHELVEAGGQVSLPVSRVRCNYPVPQRSVDLQAHLHNFSS